MSKKSNKKTAPKKASQEELQDLVIENDTGARNPSGLSAQILFVAALSWSLFQLWIASPLPFSLGAALHIPVLDSTKARYIHLGFALFLALLAYPAASHSPRNRIPLHDWFFALVASFSALYMYIFYEELAYRSGWPTKLDVVVACAGMLLLLEATRRALGPPLMIVAVVFLLYTYFGSSELLPDVIRYKGASLDKIATHQWLSTEGVFGIAVGVSTSFVFLFVLFGALLEKAGAGNYFIKVAFSLLGHLRGGPAKAAVLSSGMTGLISGSSIANVVTTGTFTVPLMRRVGFTREKAGAVEVGASVNGQIMPPVMGAAAFLMVEYVGISYLAVVKHAFLPAVISYIALLYIVHLEAVKADMKALPKKVQRTILESCLVFAFFVAIVSGLSMAVYYGVGWTKGVFGDAASYIIAVLVLGVYLSLIKFKSGYADLEMDDPNAPVIELPETGPTVKTGLHYLLPIIVLVWCLMVERLSPGLSAFWATAFMMFILLTQKPLVAFFRKQKDIVANAKEGFRDLYEGLVTGARNMIGIGVATAAAGIIVGTVSLTGIGQKLTEVVEIISGGSIMLVLVFTAIISLILGMGLPTTANYIVVSSLMVPVVVELSGQAGLIVPLIAIHMFVFYFGIMADVTPPVGLASFAAAAVSGGDPIRTGVQAFFYSSRTVILPFLFIFNPELLLIGVDSFLVGTWIFVKATIALLLFAAATQGQFIVRSKRIESAALLLVGFTLFIPQFWINMAVPKYVDQDISTLLQTMKEAPVESSVKLTVKGEDVYGEMKETPVYITVSEGKTGAEKLEKFGLIIDDTSGKLIVNDVVFNSEADKKGIDFDYELTGIAVEQDQPNSAFMYIPAVLLLLIIISLQKMRQRSQKLAKA